MAMPKIWYKFFKNEKTLNREQTETEFKVDHQLQSRKGLMYQACDAFRVWLL